MKQGKEVSEVSKEWVKKVSTVGKVVKQVR